MLYSHLSVMCTLGSTWSLFSGHLRNNLGITASWQYKQIRLSINKPQWGWGEGCFAPTEGLFLVHVLASTGIRRSPSFLSPFVQSSAWGRGALTQSTSEEIYWLLFLLLASVPGREVGFDGTREGDIPAGSMAPEATSLYLWHWWVGFASQGLLTGGRKSAWDI